MILPNSEKIKDKLPFLNGYWYKTSTLVLFGFCYAKSDIIKIITYDSHMCIIM
jgi:hypothetical protein